MRTIVIQPWHRYVLLLVLSYCRACFSIVGDTLSAGQSLSVSDSIVSQDNNFELGFFKPGTSSKIYLGIWYKRFDGKDIVWVANRENPLSEPSSLILTFSEDGNLILLEGSSKNPFWRTNLTPSPSNLTKAVLQDDGNFVLRDSSNPSSILWESFDHPTDTWLPGGKLGIDKVTGKSMKLTSWNNSEDPAPGVFSLVLDPNGSPEFFLEWNSSKIYSRSGLWNGTSFSLVPEMTALPNLNYTFWSSEKGRYFTYSLNDSSSRTKFVMTSTGLIQQLVWKSGPWVWNLFWSQPKKLSIVYALCGVFGVYRENLSNPCECLKGFEPFLSEDWSGGCVRKTQLQCEKSTYANGERDWFLKLPNVSLPINSKAYSAVGARNCEEACLNNCSCTAYAYNSSGCMIWQGGLLNLQQLSDVDDGGQEIYLRLAADEHQSNKTRTRKQWKVWVIVAVLVPATALILWLRIYSASKRKSTHTGEHTSGNNLLLFDFDIELHQIKDGTNTNNNLKSREKKEAKLPLFSYDSVSIVTNNFSATNKLGEGGFGPVYKGKLLNGQEVAIKTLSKRSGQGLEEFRNETILIAKLQHINLVRLLGCCTQKDEKILIYEYMPNKSLDFYLFDRSKKKLLCWETRIKIIEGIAQGLLYLHQYSRLRIIHRDLKPSNILLDNKMNPKISDFGIARIVGGNEIQANTTRVVGTYGYMSPEYALEGLYSTKSDIFSFGVLILEIVSGKKNIGAYNRNSVNLLQYAWELWTADRSLELMDQTMRYPSSTSTILRLINIALLCVEESPADRPTMLDLVALISNKYAPLPEPKQPAFTTGRSMTDTNPTIDRGGNCSTTITFSTMEAR